jgi:hypothetical protein
MRGAPIFLLLAIGCGAQILDDEAAGVGAGDDDGKGDDPGGGGPEPTPTQQLGPDDFLEQVGEVECDHAFLCRDEFPAADFGISFDEFVGGNTAEECYDAAEATFQPDLVAASVAAGRIAYTEVAATECLAGISFPATCAEYWMVGPTFPQICSAALIGTVADGGACTIDIDCTGADTFCESGTCTP